MRNYKSLKREKWKYLKLKEGKKNEETKKKEIRKNVQFKAVRGKNVK